MEGKEGHQRVTGCLRQRGRKGIASSGRAGGRLRLRGPGNPSGNVVASSTREKVAGGSTVNEEDRRCQSKGGGRGRLACGLVVGGGAKDAVHAPMAGHEMKKMPKLAAVLLGV